LEAAEREALTLVFRELLEKVSEGGPDAHH
jgi:hypothetical protein